MSLVSTLCSLDVQKKLMKKNLLFVVERTLQEMKKGKITAEEASQKICQIIDHDGKPPVEKLQTIQQKEVVEEVEFVSDDAIDSLSSSMSAIFDINIDDTGASSGNPFCINQFQAKPQSRINIPFNFDWSKVKELDECVILYRTHSQSRSLEETFLKYKLPYKLVSGTRFLDRKEIKDCIAILKFMANGADKISLSRFLPLVLEGVGTKTLAKILAFLDDYEYPLAPKFQEKVLELFTRIQTAWTTENTLIDLAKEVFIVSGYFKYLKKEYPNKDEYEQRMENIGELYSLMLPYDNDKEMDLQDKLTNFLEQVSLMSQMDSNDKFSEDPKISLMSLHQSKGLEFESVFLVGCEDGLLPHMNSFLDHDQMEEETRLAYVGVTRAKKNLYLIAADSRVQFGQIKANPVSRIFRPFLDKYCKRVGS